MIQWVSPSKNVPLKGNKWLVLWSGCKIRKHNKYNSCPNLLVVLISIEVLHHHVTYAATVTMPPCWMACRSNMAREVSERVPSLPGYFAGLNLDDKKSYEEKLKKISNIDPYNLSASFYSDSSENWPNIEFPDIVNYLLFTSSRYTNDQLKAYKSLDSYQYFIAGWVRCIFVRKATQSMRILIGKVFL